MRNRQAFIPVIWISPALEKCWCRYSMIPNLYTFAFLHSADWTWFCVALVGEAGAVRLGNKSEEPTLHLALLDPALQWKQPCQDLLVPQWETRPICAITAAWTVFPSLEIGQRQKQDFDFDTIPRLIHLDSWISLCYSYIPLVIHSTDGNNLFLTTD